MPTVEEVLANMNMGTMFICPVCRDNFHLPNKEPVSLPCGHTVCCPCVGALLTREAATPHLNCPVCRKRHVALNGGSAGGVPGNFSKNFSLMTVFEQFLKSAQKTDREKSFVRPVTCRECKGETTEEFCTMCDCVKDLGNGQLDFMNRSKNLLICVDCINKSHQGHDISPMNVVKAAFDNWKISFDLQDMMESIKVKAVTTCTALTNSKAEIEKLVTEATSTMERITSRQKDALLYCTSAKYLHKLEDIEKKITELGAHAQSKILDMQTDGDTVADFGKAPRARQLQPIHQRMVLQRPPAGGRPEDRYRVVVRFADNDEGGDRMAQVAQRLAAVRAFQGEEAGEQGERGAAPVPDNRLREAAQAVDGFNEMVRGLFDVLEQPRPAPARVPRNRPIQIDEDDDDDDVIPIVPGVAPAAQGQEAAPGGARRRRRGADAIMAEEAADVARAAEAREDDIADRLRGAVDNLEQQVLHIADPVHRMFRLVQANVLDDEEVDMEDLDDVPEQPEAEEPVVRRGRGRPPRHDPIQRGRVREAPRAAVRRPRRH